MESSKLMFLSFKEIERLSVLNYNRPAWFPLSWHSFLVPTIQVMLDWLAVPSSFSCERTKYLRLTLTNCSERPNIDEHLAIIGPHFSTCSYPHNGAVNWSVILEKFYKSCIQSKIDYGSLLYGTASSTHPSKNDCIQNKCVRFIIGVPPTLLPNQPFEHKPVSLPLLFRGNLLTDSFVARAMTQLQSSIIINIRFVIYRWRLTHKKHPLICEKAIDLGPSPCPPPSFRVGGPKWA